MKNEILINSEYAFLMTISLFIFSVLSLLNFGSLFFIFIYCISFVLWSILALIVLYFHKVEICEFYEISPDVLKCTCDLNG